MKTPPSDDTDPRAAVGPLEELAQAVRSGGLVKLLRGEGLDRGTVEELMQPESLTALRAILARHLSWGSERDTRGNRRDPVDKPVPRLADIAEYRRAAPRGTGRRP